MNSKKPPDIITAVVIEEHNALTFEELCSLLQTEDHFVIELVEHEVLQPLGSSHQDWRFDSINLRRARLARSFYHDLEVNLNGIALALDLLDELEKVRREA